VNGTLFGNNGIEPIRSIWQWLQEGKILLVGTSKQHATYFGAAEEILEHTHQHQNNRIEKDENVL
jgi:hypothetical protein